MSLDDLDDELAISGVFEGYPTDRRALAGKLYASGVSPDDINLLHRHCLATVHKGSPATVLLAILRDDRMREARLVDLRKIADLRATRDAERAFGDKPYVPGPTEGEPKEVWEHDRLCRVAWCRVHGDRVPVEVVAKELGVSALTVGCMVDRGRTLSASPLLAGKQPARKPEPPDPKKQVQEFRERMRSDSLSRPRDPRHRIDFARMEKKQAEILAGVRRYGTVDLADVIRSREGKGALATLEADGLILRSGPPDVHGVQPYVVASSPEEREQFKQQLRAWGTRPKPPSSEVTP